MSKMTKILLLQPPVSFKEKAFALVPNCPHLGLLYLASMLMREGHAVKYLDISDNSYSLSDVKDLIEKEGFSLLGITAMTQNIRGAVMLAQFLKENHCAVKIVLGGPHVSADTTLIQRFPYFDAAIAGEAELTFPEIAKELLAGKKISQTIRGATPMNLDELPPPARTIIDHEVYKKRGLWANGIFATRGCPFRCNFCSIPAIDKRVRFRSPELIIDEMKECVRITGFKHFNFSDDALTIKKDFVYELCDRIRQLPYRISWEAQSRINYVDRPLLRAMRKAGCTKLLFGIESGNERIRNQVIGKGITNDQIMRATSDCWKEGIEPDHYLMVGHPTETKEELAETINCPLKFKPNIIGAFITMPLPGAPLFDYALKEGSIEPDVIDKFIRGDYGEGYQGSWPYYIPKGFTLEELIQARNTMFKRFYFRPGYIFKRIVRDCGSLTKLKMDFREGLSLFLKKRSADDFVVDDKRGHDCEGNIIVRFLSRLEKQVARLPALYKFLKRCKVAYQRVKYFFFRFLKKDKELIYNKAFFDKNLEWNVPIAHAMVGILIKHFNPKSVADVGCGNAEFLSVFQKNGVDIQGFEGSPHALNNLLVERAFVKQCDLRSPLISAKKYDVVICFEVAEHIEKRFSPQLINNIISLGDTVVFTAAPPGQGGHFHINEQPHEFWIELFASKGFVFDALLSKTLRAEFNERKIISWYSDNVMVFRRKA